MLKKYKFTCKKCGSHKLVREVTETYVEKISSCIQIDRNEDLSIARVLVDPPKNYEGTTYYMKEMPTVLYACGNCSSKSRPLKELFDRGELVEDGEQ